MTGRREKRKYRDQVNREEGPAHTTYGPFSPEGSLLPLHTELSLMPPPPCWPSGSRSLLPALCPPPALCSHLNLIFPTLCPLSLGAAGLRVLPMDHKLTAGMGEAVHWARQDLAGE